VSEWRSWQYNDIGGWTRGAGEKQLVLLHGGPDLSDYLEGLGDLLADELDDSWSIVRYQQRGQSPSTSHGPFTIEQELQDLLMVCEALDGDAIWILGHSWGGHLAMHAIVATERFRGAIIVDPLGAVADGGQAAMFKHFASLLTPAEATEWVRLEQLAATNGQRSIAQLSIIWPYYFSEPAAAPPMPPIKRGSGNHDASISDHFDKQTLVNRLPSASTPALFLAGTKSPIPHEESTRSAALMPRAELELLPTGHFLWLEDPVATVAPISSFLRDTEQFRNPFHGR
jgi:pimeloyl-ACP methyl ester carboxylesterase